MDLDPKDFPELYRQLRASRSLRWCVFAIGIVCMLVGLFATFFRGESQWTFIVIGFALSAISFSALFPLSERDRSIIDEHRRRKLFSELKEVNGDEARLAAIKAKIDAVSGGKRDRLISDLEELERLGCIDSDMRAARFIGRDEAVVYYGQKARMLRDDYPNVEERREVRMREIADESFKENMDECIKSIKSYNRIHGL